MITSCRMSRPLMYNVGNNVCTDLELDRLARDGRRSKSGGYDTSLFTL